MRDEAIDFNKVFVVKVYLDASPGYNEVDVDSFDSMDEAIDYMEDGGYFGEDSHFGLTFVDNVVRP